MKEEARKEFLPCFRIGCLTFHGDVTAERKKMLQRVLPSQLFLLSLLVFLLASSFPHRMESACRRPTMWVLFSVTRILNLRS